MKSTATAVWKGNFKEGSGTFSAASGAFSAVKYDAAGRFEKSGATSPEELIAAAHASCFAMALSVQLGNAGMTAESIDSKATVSLDKLDSGWTVTKSHLEVVAKIPGGDRAKFEEAANNAKSGCPISRLLKAEITLEAKLA